MTVRCPPDVWMRELARQEACALRRFAEQGRSPRVAPLNPMDDYDAKRNVWTVRLGEQTPPSYTAPRGTTRRKQEAA
jgi:hypothetical protein